MSAALSLLLILRIRLDRVSSAATDAVHRLNTKKSGPSLPNMLKLCVTAAPLAH